jgi:uncharacterized membrane protein YdbT with pleckstrin-like domain
MSYVQQTLGPGETITYEAQFHWLYKLQIIFFMTIGWLFIIGPLVGLCLLIEKRTTEMVVTSRRFVYKRGWISRKTEELSLNKIEEINLTQSLLGRLLNYGKLHLSGTGVGSINLPAIGDPLALRRAIDSARIAVRA